MPGGRRAGSSALLCALTAVLVACGGGGTSSSTGGASSTPTPTPAPSGPATASFQFTGTEGLSTTQSSFSFLRCNTPSTKGAETSALMATGEPSVVALVSLSPSSISVSLRSGSGSTYQERDFSGALNGFNVQTGGSFNAALSPASGGTSGANSIGTLSSISGTVSCGGQTRGATTVVFNGATSKGMLSNGFDAALVECDTFQQGISVAAIGVLAIAGTKWDAFFTATTSRLTLFASSTAGQLSLTGTPGSGATVSSTGAHVTGTLTESGTSNTVTVSGDLTCGSQANF